MHEELCKKFLISATNDSETIFEMPDGPVKEKVDYMIAQCRNSPHSALVLCLMALGDCYGKIARLANKIDPKNMSEMQNFFNNESPLNNLAYRFVMNFDKLRDDQKK